MRDPLIPSAEPQHFLRARVSQDLAAGRYGGRVVTRFPPEPNGYLHIGHSKSICLNFGLAQENGGVCHLRYDDTNPSTEDPEFVESILNDVKWLGFDPKEKVFFASDYFGKLYEYANLLIRKGLAYVCDLSDEQIREYRGTVTESGKASPWRERSVPENLDLFARMQAGEFPEGSRVLRAKIDMANPNMKMRDPLLYRIKYDHHYRTGETWKVYPFYDFAHCLSDAIEGITHSICTLEFENNRELYDWILAECEILEPPHQHEFARLNLTWTVMSKRKFIQLVDGKFVEGWDDPRMPTLAGLRRRGITASALRTFCERIGIAKANSVVEIELLENTVREELNASAPRGMAVLRPVPVRITNWRGGPKRLIAPLFPTEMGVDGGSREIPMSGRIFIDEADFVEVAPKGWKRLSLGGEVRLRHGCVIRCDAIERNEAGEITELLCTADLDTFGGKNPEGRKVRGVIHWVDQEESIPFEARLYDRLFAVERPGSEGDFKNELNPDSLQVLAGRLEPAVATGKRSHWQFERLGYFFRDPIADGVVFNRVVGLRESYAVEGGQLAVSVPAKLPVGVATSPTPVPGTPPTKGEDRALDAVTAARRDALITEFTLPEPLARTLAGDPSTESLFREAVVHATAVATATFICNVVIGELRSTGKSVTGRAVGQIVALVEAGTLGIPQAKRVLAGVLATAESPAAIVAREGLAKVDDEATVAGWVDETFDRFSGEAGRYSAGEVKLAGFLVGQILKASGGRADASVVQRLVRARGPG